MKTPLRVISPRNSFYEYSRMDLKTIATYMFCVCVCVFHLCFSYVHKRMRKEKTCLLRLNFCFSWKVVFGIVCIRLICIQYLTTISILFVLSYRAIVPFRLLINLASVSNVKEQLGLNKRTVQSSFRVAVDCLRGCSLNYLTLYCLLAACQTRMAWILVGWILGV